MGATVFVGYIDKESLHVTLNRNASDALETLLDQSLQKTYPVLHEKIMKELVLDQISFNNLTKKEFNILIKTVKNYLNDISFHAKKEYYQKKVWEENIIPLIQRDKRYEVNINQ